MLFVFKEIFKVIMDVIMLEERRNQRICEKNIQLPGINKDHVKIESNITPKTTISSPDTLKNFMKHKNCPTCFWLTNYKRNGTDEKKFLYVPQTPQWLRGKKNNENDVTFNECFFLSAQCENEILRKKTQKISLPATVRLKRLSLNCCWKNN